MKKVITYGTYDLLHQGHINLLRRAKALGDYLIVGVTADGFDRDRGKLNVRNNVLERVEAVKATGLADEVIIEEYVGQKIDDIQKYNIDILRNLFLFHFLAIHPAHKVKLFHLLLQFLCPCIYL